MANTPRKTFPELTALSAPLVDSDVVAVYRAPGPAKRTTASVLKTYAQTGVQPLDADLTAIAALTSAADKMPYATGAQTWAMADLTAAGRALLDDASAAAQLTTLGLGPIFSVTNYGASTSASAAANTTAFRLACAAVEAADGGVLYVPPGEYNWGSQLFAGAGGLGYAYLGTSLMRIDNCTKPLTIILSGVKLKLASGLKFGAFNPVTGAPFASTVPFTDANYSASIGVCLDVRGCANVSVIGPFEMDGNIAATTIGGAFSSDPADTTGIQIDNYGIVSHENDIFSVSDGYIHHWGTDGVLIAYTGLALSADPKPHTLTNIVSTYNGRQGLSVIGANSLVATNCDFSYTGRSTVQSNPGAGVDIEPEGGAIVTNCNFYSCRTFANRGVGVVAAVAGASNCSFFDCDFIGTTSNPIWIDYPGFEFYGCTVVGQVTHLYGNATDRKKATKVFGGKWSQNTADSPSGVVLTGASIFDQGPVRFHAVDFDAAATVLPQSTYVNRVEYYDCTFKQTSGSVFSTQGVFSGVNRFTITGDNKWNILDAYENYGQIFYNDKLFDRKEVQLALVNGANNNIVIPFPISGDDTVYVYITGPTAAFDVSGFVAPASPGFGATQSNTQLVLINQTGQTMTVKFGGASSFNNQILIGGSADLPITNHGSVTMIYSIYRPGWVVTGYKA